MSSPRRQFLHLTAGAAALLAAPCISSAQTYPTRPVTMVVPYGAGGPSDTLGRIVAEGMRGALGQPVIVENAAGASGRSEEHTSELQSRRDLVCRLLLEKKKLYVWYLSACNSSSLFSRAPSTICNGLLCIDFAPTPLPSPTPAHLPPAGARVLGPDPTLT